MDAFTPWPTPFSPKEIDFFAKDELVSILPNFSLPTDDGHCQCMMGDFGPFQPNRICEVPLWLALALWKRRKCTIRPPEWMAVDYLQRPQTTVNAAVLELERQDPSSFQPLPFHYQEVAQCLFTGGHQESLPKEVFGDEQARIRDLINLIQKTRYNKILQGLGTMREAAAVKLNNLSAMELNSVRAFFTGALDQFHKYGKMSEVEAINPPTTQTDMDRSQEPVRQLRRRE